MPKFGQKEYQSLFFLGSSSLGGYEPEARYIPLTFLLCVFFPLASKQTSEIL